MSRSSTTVFFAAALLVAVPGARAKSTSAADRIETLLNKAKSHTSGPNCFNSALYVSGLLDSIRLVAPDEMEFWMGSDLCKKIDKLPNDLTGLIFTIESDQGLEHSGYFKDSQSIFSKSSDLIEDSWSYRKPQDEFSNFTKGKLKWPLADSYRGGQALAQFGFRVELYRCEDLGSYLKRLDPKLFSRAVYDKVSAEILDIEKTFENFKNDKEVNNSFCQRVKKTLNDHFDAKGDILKIKTSTGSEFVDLTLFHRIWSKVWTCSVNGIEISRAKGLPPVRRPARAN